MIRSIVFRGKSGVAALVVGLSSLLPLYAAADIVSAGASVTITQSYAYTSFGGGDFVFSTSIGAPGCGSGFYIKSTDPGYKAAVAAVLTAQSNGNFVQVYGDNADLWAGSPSGQYCRLQTIGVTS